MLSKRIPIQAYPYPSVSLSKEGDMHLGEELDEEELERDLAGESPNDEDEAVMDLS